MALGALSLSLNTGRLRRPFEANLVGLTTGKVEILNDGTPGFSTVNGRVMHSGLPYDVNTLVIRESEPGVGVGFRDSRIQINATDASGVAVPGNSTASVPAAQTGALYTLTRVLDPASTFTLRSGSDANLSITGGNSISATAGLSAGVSQIALVRESIGSGNDYRDLEYRVTLTAQSADLPALSFASPTVSIPEGDSGTTTVSNTLNVTRNGITGALAVNLTYGGTAMGGVDYATAPVSATIPNGQNSVSFDIQVNGDTTVEADETIIITATLAAYPAVTAGKTITITNDDSAPLRQAATRSQFCNQFVGTLTGIQTRTSHYVRRTGGSTGPMPEIYLGRIVTQSGALVELPLTGTTTIKAAIEYPAGTFTPLTFGGASSASGAGGTRVRADKPTVAIPNGAEFWVRWNLFNADGLMLLTGYPYKTGDGFEGAFSGAAATDKTTSGTVTQSTGNMVLPCAIVEAATGGALTDISVYCVGNSRVAGVGDTGDATGDVGEIARSIGATNAYINGGISGDRVDWWMASNSARLGVAAYCSHVIANWGINEAGTYTSSALAGLMTSFAALFPGKPVWATTVAPWSTGAWTLADGSDQTSVGSTSVYNAYSDLLRAGSVPGLGGYFEVADVVTLTRNAGKWKAPGFTTDGLHETQAAYVAIRNSGAINPNFVVPSTVSNLLISTGFPNGVPVIGYVENVQAGETVTCNVPGITLGTQSGSLIPYTGTPSGGAATIANAFVSVLGGVTTNYSRDVILAPALTRVTAFGNSMAAGSNATTTANRFANRFATAAGTTPRNVGIGGSVLQNTGSKTDNGRDRFLTACNVPKFAEVLLQEYGGFNDVSAIADGLTPALFKNDLEEVVSGLRGLGWQTSQIYQATMFWQTDARVAGKPYTRADIAAYNQAVKEVAYDYGLPMADVHYATLDRPDLVDADGTHPNDTGHNVFYQTYRGAAVRNPNPFPTRLTQQVVSTTSFTAGWTAPVGKTVTNYTFQYGVDGDFTFPNSQTITGTTVTPTGLTSGTAYHWRVRANFSDGSYSRWQIADGYIKPQASANVTSGSVTGLVGVADGTALTATTPAQGTWTVPWGQGALRVLGERIVPASGGAASTDLLCNIPFVNDGVYGETIIDVKTNGSGLQTQIILRGNDTVATAGDFNALAAMYGNGGVNIYAITGGTSTAIATATIGALSAGEHKMRFEVQRRQQRLYIDDVLVAWGAEDDGALPANLGGNCGVRSIGAITASVGPTVKTVKFGTL